MASPLVTVGISGSLAKASRRQQCGQGLAHFALSLTAAGRVPESVMFKMGSHRMFLTLFCIALCGVLTAEACTSGSYKDPNNTSTYISWRLLDLPSTYFNDLAFVPAGMHMSLLPVTGRSYSTLGSSVRVRHSFVCMTASEDIIRLMMAAADPGLVMDSETWPGACSEGFNTKGLHVSSLMQPSSTGINTYTSGPAVEQLDIANYLLALYDSVDAIRSDLDAGRLKLVLNPNFEIITRLMFQTNYSTLHYNIHDNSGKSMVIEYSGPNNLQWWDSTPYNGALANNPLWEDQIAYYNNWWATQSDPYITFHDSEFLNLPGSYNSSHRFIRAATLPKPGYDWEWPAYVETSPRYAVNGQPDTNPAIIAAMNTMFSVYLPKGVDDAGGQQYPGGNTHRDIVWFSFIADHKYGDYYYRAANTPQWKRVELDQVAWGSMGCIKYMKLRGGRWWQDVSNDWAPTSREAALHHSAPEATLDALRADIAGGANFKP